MSDVLVAEQAHDVQQGVGVAERRDVEQVFGAGLRRARHVGKLHGGRHTAPRVEERGEPIEAVVGHARDADMRVQLAVMRRAPWSRALVIRRKSVVLPVEGKPMRPARSIG